VAITATGPFDFSNSSGFVSIYQRSFGGSNLHKFNQTLQALTKLILVLLGATFLLSLIVRLLPGSPADFYTNALDEEGRLAQIKDLGLDRNVFSGYLHWLFDFVRGDFGPFFMSGGGTRPTSLIIGQAVPRSLLIMLYVQIVSLVISIPLGLITAYRADKATDRVISTALFAGSAIPGFALALALGYYLGVKVQIFPTIGYVPISEGLGEHFKHLALPVISLSVPLCASYARILRTEIISTLRQDFVTMAVSKGISNSRVLVKHVLRPSSTALITTASLNMGGLIGGTVIIDQIFALGGMGQQITFAVFARQYIALQSYIALIAVAFILFTVLADALIGVVDPRTKNRNV
jgi:peptide/nickel transport system permease protein